MVTSNSTRGEEGWLMTADYTEVEETREDLEKYLEVLNADEEL